MYILAQTWGILVEPLAKTKTRMERLFQSSILGCWLLLVVVQGYTISPNRHHHRPKALVQRTTTTPLGLSGNNNDSDDSSSASQKIQEMAAFVSVGLLQSVVKEMTNTNNVDSDEISDQTIQTMDRLTRALQLGTKTDVATTKTASLENDIHSGDKDEPIAAALGETDTDIQSSFTNEAAAASATTNDDSQLDNEKVNEKIVDEKLEPEPEDQYAWSPLEVVASNVVPLRSSSIPKKADPSPAAKPLAESAVNSV